MNLKKIFVISLFFLPAFVFANNKSDLFAVSNYVVIDSFKNYVVVSPKVTTPTAVEVPLTRDPASLPVFAVFNQEKNEFEPYFLSQKVNHVEIKSKIQAVGSADQGSYVNDNNYDTYLEFPLTFDSNKAEITFNFEKPITTSSLSFVLDSNVAFPKDISVHAVVGGVDYVALASSPVYSSNVTFPKTTSSTWRVVFDYVQPLRILEMKFDDMTVRDVESEGVRFLALPKQTYKIYYNADRYVSPHVAEAGNLSSNEGVLVYADTMNGVVNSEYKPADEDGDSVPDLKDNCISLSNKDQIDADKNGRGDACEDYDRDGVVEANDNCKEVPNASQVDTDQDGQGDACDAEDNRLGQTMPWLPWLGVGIGGLVVVGLFVVVLKHKPTNIPPNTIV